MKVKCARPDCKETFPPRGSGKSAKKYCSAGCRNAGSIKKWNERHPDSMRYRRYLDSAKKKARELGGDPWLPTEEEFVSFTSQRCAYCNRAFPYVGIDRMINEVGYDGYNIAPFCWTCQRGKGDLKMRAWLEHLLFGNEHFTRMKEVLNGNGGGRPEGSRENDPGTG